MQKIRANWTHPDYLSDWIYCAIYYKIWTFKHIFNRRNPHRLPFHFFAHESLHALALSRSMSQWSPESLDDSETFRGHFKLPTTIVSAHRRQPFGQMLESPTWTARRRASLIS